MSTSVLPGTSAETKLETTRDVVVETRNLTKVYRDFWGRQKVRALKALDLSIFRGEIFGLLGPNGSGKTTTMKLLLGLLFPTEGEALVFGKPATDVSKNERIGYLPEETYLYRFLTGEETLDFYGRLFNIPAAVRRQRSAELLELVGLTAARKRQLREYSKGMARRLGLAQALINDPDLILLDEPTTGLHFADIQKLLKVLHSLVDKGNTVVVIEHNLDVIKSADWIIDLGPEGGDKGGYVIAEGTPEQVIEVERSYTGQYLRHVLAGHEARQPSEVIAEMETTAA